MPDRIDRTLSEDPQQAVWVEHGSVYHDPSRTEEDLIITGCGETFDPGRSDLSLEDETAALEGGVDRCSKCRFDHGVALYMLGAKEYHLPVEAEHGTVADCRAMSATGRSDVVERGVACLDHNGIERCEECDWSDQQ